MAAGREVVVDVDRVGALRQPFEGDSERDDAALRVAGVVAVEIPVLPGHIERCPLVEVHGFRGDRRAGATGEDRNGDDGRQRQDAASGPPLDPSIPDSMSCHDTLPDGLARVPRVWVRGGSRCRGGPPG